MKKIRMILSIVLSLIVLYTIIGFFILPPVLTSVLSKNLTQALKRNVAIEKIRFNPYTLVAVVQGLSIKDQDRPGAFVSLRSLTVDVQWASLFKLAPIIRELKLDRPSIKVIRFEDGTYNFSDLMKGGKKKEKPQEFSLSNIQIVGGVVVMDDMPVHKTHTAKDINITIPFVSNIPYYTNVFVQPTFRATINGTPFQLKGKTKPFSDSLETTLALSLKDINLPNYLAYVPMKLGFDIDSGSLDLNALFSYRQFRTKQQPILNISADLACKDLDVKDQGGNPILHIPKMTTKLAPSRLLKKQIHVEQIAVSSPELIVSRDKKGMLNMVQALQKTETKETSPPAKEKPAANPVLLVIDKIDLTGGKIQYTDLSGSSPVKIAAESLSIAARGITTDKQGSASADISCTLNRTGHLALGTSCTLNPLSADIKLSLDGFQPSWLQPYIIDQVPILIRRGTISSQGRIKIALAPKVPPRINFAGDVQFSDFASVNRAHAEDLVSWKNLTLSGIDFSLSPGHVVIRDIAFVSPGSSFIINPDGNNNFAAALGKPKEPKASPQPAKGEKTLERIAVGKITFKNGRFSFSDKSIVPHYSTSLTGISGSISGLSSDEFRKASVNLKAKLDNQAPIAITGSINPLKQDLFVDLTASFNNIELSPVTPYSGKYLGYAIDKGKLSLALKYLIDKKQLQAQNDVLIDQLTFGNSVESKDATKLPVRLAVVLLRDNSGKIDLHLPISGRTDDPDFHVGKIIIRTIVNILEKAATSPFALLEALYPGSTELSFIGFEPGRSSLSEEGKKKLDKVVRILTDRTALNLELSGYVDASGDKTGLNEYMLERRLKELKLKDILRKGRQAPGVDDTVIDPKEYSGYLARAYKAFDFPGKPKNVLGFAKTLPDDEMKKLMLENIKVTDDDLKALAEERSQKARDYLVESGKMDPARIFLVKANALAPEKMEKVPDSRVSLTIK
jgi:uncharacterized protein involved in outer membrane biogenesis